MAVKQGLSTVSLYTQCSHAVSYPRPIAVNPEEPGTKAGKKKRTDAGNDKNRSVLHMPPRIQALVDGETKDEWWKLNGHTSPTT